MRLIVFGLMVCLLLLATPLVYATENENELMDQTLQNKNTALIKIENGVLGSLENFSGNEKLSVVLGEEFGLTSKEVLVKKMKNFGLETISILVTGYSSTVDQCDADPFITASGKRVHLGTMACPREYPFGTQIYIEGVGDFVCEDRGGAIKGQHFDMWFETRAQALKWGKKTVSAVIKMPEIAQK